MANSAEPSSSKRRVNETICWAACILELCSESERSHRRAHSLAEAIACTPIYRPPNPARVFFPLFISRGNSQQTSYYLLGYCV